MFKILTYLNAHMKKIIVSLLVSILAVANVTAKTLSNLYDYSASVTDTSKSTKLTAAKTGLDLVLQRVSSQFEIVASEQIAGAHEHIADYIEQWSYHNTPQGLELSLKFSKPKVDDLITSAGFVVWQESRPLSLIYLAVDEDSARQLISDTDDLAIKAKANAKEHAIPIIFPLYDLLEADSVSLSDVWQNNFTNLQNNAARYGADAIVSGRIYSEDLFNYTGVWHLSLGTEKQETWVLTGREPSDVINAFFASYAKFLVNRLAGHNTEKQSDVTVTISNINDLHDYARVEKFMTEIAQIKQASLVKVDSDSLTFAVELTGDILELKDALALTHHLHNNNFTPTDNTLTYSWAP